MKFNLPIATIYYSVSEDYSLVSSLRVPAFGYLKKEKAKRYVSRYKDIDFNSINIVNIERDNIDIDFDLSSINYD